MFLPIVIMVNNIYYIIYLMDARSLLLIGSVLAATEHINHIASSGKEILHGHCGARLPPGNRGRAVASVIIG